MNARHLEYCAGHEWAFVAREYIVPWVTAGVDLGEHLLEVGPGPGATTDALRLRVPALTAVQVDEVLAATLAERLKGTNVTVVHGDAAELQFEAGRFSSAICLTMLHHVPSEEMQDRLLKEMGRLVRSGGPVIGSDNLDGLDFRAFHEGDVCLPLDPDTLQARLERLGFRDVEVTRNEYAYRFVAEAP